MRLDCAAGKHAPAAPGVRNQGLEFGCCRGCGRDLVRSRGAWRTVPRGFRVVWRQGPPAEAASARQLLLDLPANGRALTRVPAPPLRRRRLAAAVEMVALGTRGAASALAERLRAWLKVLLTPPPASQPVLCLPLP